jgi:hypothetical protein
MDSRTRTDVERDVLLYKNSEGTGRVSLHNLISLPSGAEILGYILLFLSTS